MPFALALLRGMLSSVWIRLFLARLALGIGISIVTYHDVGILFTDIYTQWQNSLSGIRGDAFQVMLLFKFPQALNVIASSLTASLVLKGMTAAGSISRIAFNPAALIGQ